MERGAFRALRVADAATHRDNLHLLWEIDALVTQGVKDGFESGCIYMFQLKSSSSFQVLFGVGFHLFTHTHTPHVDLRIKGPEELEIYCSKPADFFRFYSVRQCSLDMQNTITSCLSCVN